MIPPFTTIFILFAILLIAFAVITVKEKNITHSAIYLSIFLLVMAGVFVFLGASFIGAVEVLVYIGAVVTLIVFTVMLTGGKEIE
ncbi:MAG: NADH-quinone oxidoreductase subunit J [Thermoplasmata archaeon]